MQDDFVVISYEVRNSSDKELRGFHVGLFADWDIGDLLSNVGGIDSLRGLAYQYDPTRTDSNYYGVVALSGMSGAAVTSDYPDMKFVRTINPVSDPVGQQDLRTFVGSGPFALDPDDIARAAFALVAGTTLADLQAHADSARALWGDRTLSVETGDWLPRQAALEQNYPNPFNPQSDIRFETAEAGEVRLVVYDLLGREVAVLVNDRRPAGSYQVRFDAADLASGIYLYRLTAGHFTQTRKMILVK